MTTLDTELMYRAPIVDVGQIEGDRTLSATPTNSIPPEDELTIGALCS